MKQGNELPFFVVALVAVPVFVVEPYTAVAGRHNSSFTVYRFYTEESAVTRCVKSRKEKALMNPSENQ